MSLSNKAEAERFHHLEDLLGRLESELESAREEDRVVADSLMESARRLSERAEAAATASEAATARAEVRATRTDRRLRHRP